MLYRAVSLFVTISPLSFYNKYKDERKALDFSNVPSLIVANIRLNINSKNVDNC